uniref:restriction endonuclease subunit S n=2 Tax=Mycoplasmopsis bovis TaxID=28903 RepID=UPI003D29C7E1
MMIASDVKKYGKFDVYDPNKIVGKTDAEPFRSDYISIVKDGDAGRIRLLPKNTMILSTMGALIAKDPFKIDFLYYMLNAINDLSRERNGSIIPHIYFKDYGQNIYNLPSIPEQSKISSLFTYLDSLITLHQRKLSSLKNLKNRLLDRMFCDEKSQFPSIRFTEFTNAWEQKKLRNVVSYHSSVMIASDVKKYGKFDVYDPNKIVGKTDAEPFRSDYISIVKDGDAGRIRLLPKNTMILSTMGALIAKDPFKIDFLYYMLNAINDLARERNGSIIPHIYFKDYGQNIYNLPSTPEQSKISSLFTRLDSLITLHQRKLLSLKNLKSRLLDRMFCDEKSQFPSIRFKEFTNAWEQKKLRNVVSYHSSMMIASDVKKYGKFDVYDPNKIVGKTDAEPFRSDYISIVKDGDAGRIRLLPKNTMILSTMGALIAKDPFKIDFLYYMLNAINDLSRERNGSIIPHIYFKDYGQNIYNLPSIPEQSKISSLFTYLDSLITLHQRKLLSLKNLKSRLLDRMFCDEKSQFPSIRFKEFTNTWEQDTAKNLFIPYRVKNSSNMNLVSYSVTNKDGFVNQNEYFD